MPAFAGGEPPDCTQDLRELRMICNQCHRNARTQNGLCPTCAAIADLRKAGYAQDEITVNVEMMEDGLDDREKERLVKLSYRLSPAHS